jgi:hypothetical protein
MNRTILYSSAVGALLVLAALALTSGGGAKASAQLKLAARSGEAGPRWGVMRDAPVKGMAPPPYGAHCPPGAIPRPITGPHPILRHPASCSPNMSAQMARGYDWMFCPPSEDDI